MAYKHFNPAIAHRLQALVVQRDWDTLLSYLDGLSNAHFRTAGYLLGEQIMPNLSSSDFWLLAERLVRYNSKAFLVTILKSATSEGVFTPSVAAQAFLSSLLNNEVDVHKCIAHLLPNMSTPEDALWLLNTLHCSDPRQRISFFINSTTIVTAFLLMRTLHEVEDDRILLIRTTSYLMKKGDGLSFNIASLICACFGLEEVKGTFSLHIRPYEIARLMSDFSAFRQTLQP